MSSASPVLHMLCGKIAAGKSTLAARLGRQDRTVLLAEDEWLGALFADRMTTARDYVRCAASLQQVMGPHVVSLLNAEVSVVLDFPANTVESRKWMRSILDRTAAAHQLHVLNPPDEVCLARLRARNAQGDHPFAATEEQFRQFSRHFVAPSPEEDFNIVVHGDNG
ncbi:AAA family ATPase [Frigidibacter sp. ROC022]|uniref:AAA family ATPase n=1 Tax=Frigidibacter sp. ROC022 TaxID=2971796 RepID=UPI00215B1E1E|nr:ATP-binding protein [Frigidibacter sp. ROC022]MCR8725178.1 ATP-binding protein [Frigidibacter sp. ROC022]